MKIAKQFTLYWKDGRRQVVVGKSAIKAMRDAGCYDEYLKLDFYADGDCTKYIWSDDRWTIAAASNGILINESQATDVVTQSQQPRYTHSINIKNHTYGLVYLQNSTNEVFASGDKHTIYRGSLYKITSAGIDQHRAYASVTPRDQNVELAIVANIEQQRPVHNLNTVQLMKALENGITARYKVHLSASEEPPTRWLLAATSAIKNSALEYTVARQIMTGLLAIRDSGNTPMPITYEDGQEILAWAEKIDGFSPTDIIFESFL